MQDKKDFSKRKRYIKKTTHMFMNDKKLTSIKPISLPTNLTVIYFYNNNITNIENLEAAKNLKFLYLQKNRISKIENLNGLKNLRKLYLGHNEISVVEGLDTLSNLEELHVEKQKLKAGESLCFDPRTIIGVADSLKHLNAAHNNIISMANLAPLKNIMSLNIGFNQLKNMSEVCDTLQDWYYLQHAIFKGNPICEQQKCRENLIAHSVNLVLLDNKEVHDVTRRFIKLFEREKLNNSCKRTINLVDNVPSVAKNYPLSIQKAVSQSILMNKSSEFDTTLQVEGSDTYLPWNAMPRSVPNIPKNFRIQRKGRVTTKTLTFTSPF